MSRAGPAGRQGFGAECGLAGAAAGLCYGRGDPIAEHGAPGGAHIELALWPLLGSIPGYSEQRGSDQLMALEDFMDVEARDYHLVSQLGPVPTSDRANAISRALQRDIWLSAETQLAANEVIPGVGRWDRRSAIFRCIIICTECGASVPQDVVLH